MPGVGCAPSPRWTPPLNHLHPERDGPAHRGAGEPETPSTDSSASQCVRHKPAGLPNQPNAPGAPSGAAGAARRSPFGSVGAQVPGTSVQATRRPSRGAARRSHRPEPLLLRSERSVTLFPGTPDLCPPNPRPRDTPFHFPQNDPPERSNSHKTPAPPPRTAPQAPELFSLLLFSDGSSRKGDLSCRAGCSPSPSSLRAPPSPRGRKEQPFETKTRTRRQTRRQGQEEEQRPWEKHALKRPAYKMLNRRNYFFSLHWFCSGFVCSFSSFFFLLVKRSKQLHWRPTHQNRGSGNNRPSLDSAAGSETLPWDTLRSGVPRVDSRPHRRGVFL